MSYDDMAAQIADLLVSGSAGLIDQATTDATLVKPRAGKVTAWIEQPDVDWPGWTLEPEWTFRILLVAGTPTTVMQAIPLLHRAMAALHDSRTLPLDTSRPSGFDLAGAGTLAAYEITLKPM